MTWTRTRVAYAAAFGTAGYGYGLSNAALHGASSAVGIQCPVVLVPPPRSCRRTGSTRSRRPGTSGRSSRGRIHRYVYAQKTTFRVKRDVLSPRACQSRRSRTTAVPARTSNGRAPGGISKPFAGRSKCSRRWLPGITHRAPISATGTSVRNQATFTERRGRGDSSSTFWRPPSWCHRHRAGSVEGG